MAWWKFEFLAREGKPEMSVCLTRWRRLACASAQRCLPREEKPGSGRGKQEAADGAVDVAGSDSLRLTIGVSNSSKLSLASAKTERAQADKGKKKRQSRACWSVGVQRRADPMGIGDVEERGEERGSRPAGGKLGWTATTGLTPTPAGYVPANRRKLQKGV